MRRLGTFLLLLGLCVGVGTATAPLLPWHLSGLAWLLGVGMIKLGFASALGLMGAGAVAQRLANRGSGQPSLPPSPGAST
jgi:hypothetical protein